MPKNITETTTITVKLWHMITAIGFVIGTFVSVTLWFHNELQDDVQEIKEFTKTLDQVVDDLENNQIKLNTNVENLIRIRNTPANTSSALPPVQNN